jgi:ferritin
MNAQAAAASILKGAMKQAADSSPMTPAPGEAQETPKTGDPLKGTVLELVNQQYHKEIASAEQYFAMEAFFTDIKLEGFAAYFHRAGDEERTHARRFFDYLAKCNIRMRPESFDKARIDFESPLAACKFFLEHEKLVTKLIQAIADACMQTKDFYTFQFIQWFLNEQLEEVRKAEDLCKKVALVGNDRTGLLLLDGQLKG